MAIHIGCGSWADAEYVGALYPRDLPAKQRLSGYAKWFDHVEVNSSYYAAPRPSVVENWLALTPAKFTFDLKLHRTLSQAPQKAATENRQLDSLKAAAQPLIRAKKFGAFLLVLAPHFGPGRHQLNELDAVIEKLRPQLLAVELRHAGWIDAAQRAKTMEYFRTRELVWVAVDMPRIEGSTIMPVVDEVTNEKLAYLRLHGRNPRWLDAASAAARHHYEYSAAELAEIVARIHALQEKTEDVHVIANNHAADFAPKTALALRRLLGLRTPRGGV